MVLSPLALVEQFWCYAALETMEAMGWSQQGIYITSGENYTNGSNS